VQLFDMFATRPAARRLALPPVAVAFSLL